MGRTVERFAERLFESPELHLQRLDVDQDQVVFRPMTRETYRLSSFLDRRVITSGNDSYRVDLSELLEWFRSQSGLDSHVHYIFHGALCGSTLLSRCMDATGTCFSLREPKPLHQLALLKRGIDRRSAATTWSKERWQEVLRFVVALEGRRYEPSECVVVKPTDSCNNIIRDLFQLDPASRGLFLYASLPDFLIQVLKSGRSGWVRQRLRWANDHAEVDGLAARNIVAATLNDACAAALLWLTQAFTYISTHRDVGSARLRTLTFSTLTQRPSESLRASLVHFGVHADRATIESAARTETALNAKRRGDFATGTLDEERERTLKEHGPAIREAVDWAHDLLDRDEMSNALEVLPWE